MGQNLTGQTIASTYEDLVQISGSILTNGLGNNINIIDVVATSASLADTAISASFATTASFASFATTASYAENAAGVPNALTTASISNATITFTKGNASTFGITVNNVVNATSASLAANATSASFATTATSATTASFASTAVSSSYALTASVALNASTPTLQQVLDAGSSATGSINLLGNITATTFIGALQGNANTATTASFATNAANAANAANATSASFASTIANGLNINANTVTASAATFTNLTAVSASFGYVETTTGSAVIIGDAFIILNADSPTLPFAGIKVYDTGSASTASLEWNGNTDNWIVVEEAGASAMILTGLTGSKGSEAAPAVNKLLKGTGNHTVADSSITDNGTNVSFSTPIAGTQISASTGFLGNLIGTASIATSASFATTAFSATSASFATNATTTTSASFASTASFASSIGTIPSITVSGTGSFGALSVTGPVSGSVIGNNTDTFTSTAKIQQVVSLTQTEYNSISASASPSTLYYITDAASFATSASYALSASYAFNATSASFATTAFNATSASFASTATSASFASTASFVSGVALLGSDNTFTSNNVFSGSVRGEVKALTIASNTASMDLSADNFFTLQLVSGSNTFINPSNILPGQTINLRVNTTGSATVSFPSSVKQVSGSSYVPTTTTGVDVVTFISFDSTSLLLSNVKNLV
jgi:hypothetical protein